MNLMTNELRRASTILTRRDKHKIAIVVGLNIVLGCLDLLGVAAVGLVGALAVIGFGASTPSPRINQLMEFLNLNNLEFQLQVAILGIVAGAAFIIRTISSIYVNKRIMYFFSRKGASLANELFAKVLNQNLTGLRRRTTQEYNYLFGEGITNLTIGTLATASTIVSDLILLCILFVGIFFADVGLGLTILLTFGALGFFLNRLTGRRAKEIGIKDAALSLKSYLAIYDSISGFPERYAGNTLGSSVDDFHNLKNQHSEVLAQRQFLPILSKYLIESAVIFLALGVAALQFLLGSAGQAIGALSIFLGAGSRIAPAVLRIQQSLVTFRASSKSTELTLELISELTHLAPLVGSKANLVLEHNGFKGTVEIATASFKYPKTSSFVLDDISLQIPAGSFVAIIGPSGAGKSTLVDAMLGLVDLDKGLVSISGEKPKVAINKWPGAVAYVPQSIVLTNESMIQNVISGYAELETNRRRALEMLELVHLNEIAIGLSNGFDSKIGERGEKLSGGQAQRLGLARALFSNPQLLFLDEATSALDGETEKLVSETLEKLRGRTTIITIAHRLNTVKKADLVIYLENGQLRYSGSFEEVSSQVPGLASLIQAK
jgi:ABC-type multidrug transport system fused ATPase/permease subunit